MIIPQIWLSHGAGKLSELREKTIAGSSFRAALSLDQPEGSPSPHQYPFSHPFFFFSPEGYM